MKDLEINNSLQKEDLFGLFKTQLKKEFEHSGLDARFTDELPNGFEKLKEILAQEIRKLTGNNSFFLSGLLYKIDISERQLKEAQSENLHASFEETLAELIIKRVLQKVILRKKFSK